MAAPSPITVTGEIAGTAIGCLVAGLLIGGLVAFLFLRRQFQQRSSRSPSGSGSGSGQITLATESKAFGPSSSVAHSHDIQLAQFLLDVTPDKDLLSELQSLGELIRQHVDNHYHSRPVQASPQPLVSALRNLGFGDISTLTIEEVVGACIDPQTRQAGLQHVIALLVFTSIDFSSSNSRSSGSRYSMLPNTVSSLLQSMPPPEARGGEKEAVSLALSRWRTLSAFLLHPMRSQRTPLSPAQSEVFPKAKDFATALNTYLGHFTHADQGQQRQTDHLQAVIFECAKFGYEILSQPGEWRFTYFSDAGVESNVQTQAASSSDCLSKNRIRRRGSVGLGSFDILPAAGQDRPRYEKTIRDIKMALPISLPYFTDSEQDR
ncbi:hypothetical protein Cob_v012973 [Colletotrichum orbiculare MAFF 240422]|uniref:Uncharacterized protein n=1 Tax=Colletotrichum orbiculare (strain 104-T / ATCC 96160 / CBS 514.97 / LARS 414 / MAFF 240422) TaxID=1213857 RepID=A0A484F898_COLOR|nr:hypothetical protein Cob_v012973 [Colletotrichum orbiculare MAFF 240422]